MRATHRYIQMAVAASSTQTQFALHADPLDGLLRRATLGTLGGAVHLQLEMEVLAIYMAAEEMFI